MQREKQYVTLPEAMTLCGREMDWIIEAASEGLFKAFVIAKRWSATAQSNGVAQIVTGYVELLPETMLASRNSDRVLIDQAKLPSGATITFETEQSVYMGGVYVRRDALEEFAATGKGNPASATSPTSADPGPKALANLERTVGLLAHFIAHKIPKSRYLRGGDSGTSKVPNAKQLAEDVVAHLKTHGFSKKYLSESAVQKRIIDGLASLRPKSDDD
jgi:hypothetical protein